MGADTGSSAARRPVKLKLARNQLGLAVTLGNCYVPGMANTPRCPLFWQGGVFFGAAGAGG